MNDKPESLLACEALVASKKHFEQCKKCYCRLFSGEVSYCAEYCRLRSEAMRLAEAAVESEAAEWTVAP